MFNITEIDKIVVHGGKAHLDDVMACAIAVAARAWATKDATASDVLVPIERRDPTERELEDERVLVLDVGGRLEPEKGNFDHHQLPRGTKSCAMTLLASDLAFDDLSTVADLMAAVYPWFETRAVVDSCGPFQAAKEAGTDWATVEKFLGPFEDLVLRLFEESDPDGRARSCAELARDILAKAEAWDAVVDRLRYPAVDGCVEIVDFTEADPAKSEVVSDAILRKYDRGVAIFHDNRGPGLTLLRLKDDPRIDFSRVQGDPRVAFAHAGGFIAKTVGKDMDAAFDLIRRSVKGAA